MIKNYINKLGLNNKTVFIVGGSGLIGKEVVLALQEAGANILILDKVEKVLKKIKK